VVLTFLNARNGPTIGAVVLLVSLAVAAFEARADLSANTDSVADLDSLHVFADLEGAANDFVANTERHGGVTPATYQRRHVSSKLFSSVFPPSPTDL
jgi:hypothetical protein